MRFPVSYGVERNSKTLSPIKAESKLPLNLSQKPLFNMAFPQKTNLLPVLFNFGFWITD
jgi:hypothetical protein